jgi:hypothetical protein
MVQVPALSHPKESAGYWSVIQQTTNGYYLERKYIMTFIPVSTNNDNVKQIILTRPFTAAAEVAVAGLLDINEDGQVLSQGAPEKVSKAASDPVNLTRLQFTGGTADDGPYNTNGAYYQYQKPAFLTKHNKFVQCRISNTSQIRAVVTSLDDKITTSHTFTISGFNLNSSYDFPAEMQTDGLRTMIAVNENTAVWVWIAFDNTGVYRAMHTIITIADDGTVSCTLEDLGLGNTERHPEIAIVDEDHYIVSFLDSASNGNSFIKRRSNGSTRLTSTSLGAGNGSNFYWALAAKDGVIIHAAGNGSGNMKYFKGAKYDPVANTLTTTTTVTVTAAGSIGHNYIDRTFPFHIVADGLLGMYGGKISYDPLTGAVSSAVYDSTGIFAAMDIGSWIRLADGRNVGSVGSNVLRIYSSSGALISDINFYSYAGMPVIPIYPHPTRTDMVIMCANKLLGLEYSGTISGSSSYFSFYKCGRRYLQQLMNLSPAIDGGWPMPPTAVRMTNSLYAGILLGSGTDNKNVYTGVLKTIGNITSVSVSTEMLNYELARYNDNTLLSICNTGTGGNEVRLRAYTVSSGSITNGSVTASLKAVDKNTHISVRDNMAFYEWTDGGTQKITGRLFTVSGNSITLGTEFTVAGPARVYPGQHGYQIQKYDATTNLFCFINNSDGIPKIVKTDGTTTTSYDVNAINSNRLRIAQLSATRFVAATSTTANSMNLYLTDGSQNIHSILGITGRVMYVIPWTATKVVVAYSPSTITHSTGRYRNADASSSVTAWFRGVTTDGDFGEGYICYSNSNTIYNTSLIGRRTIFIEGVTTSGGTFSTRIADNPEVAKAIAAQGWTNSSQSSGMFAMYLNGAQSYETIFQVVELVNDELVLGEALTTKNFNVLDGGRLDDYSFWVRDVWGNYVEGALKEIGRRIIGVAKGNALAGETVKVGLFGEKIDSGWSDLEVGQGISNATEEIGWAISDTEVLQYSKD